MKVFVLSAGMMGRAVVHDLAAVREVRQTFFAPESMGRYAQASLIVQFQCTWLASWLAATDQSNPWSEPGL